MSLQPLETVVQLSRRFWSFVDRRGPEECWPFNPQSCDRDGYGRFSHGHKKFGAHQVAFVLHGGVLPEGGVVRHSCDNPPCCNPAHLSAGTHAQNVADRDSRGRQAAGERNGRANLTVAIVEQIISAPRTEKCPVVAARLGVNVCVVRDIRKGKTWKHVPRPTTHPELLATL